MVLSINTGFFKKKRPSQWSTTPQRLCPPHPPIQCCLLNFVFGGLQKKNSHFCWWCSALPITKLKLGVAGVKQGISVVSCGWLFFLKDLVCWILWECSWEMMVIDGWLVILSGLVTYLVLWGIVMTNNTKTYENQCNLMGIGGSPGEPGPTYPAFLLG